MQAICDKIQKHLRAGGVVLVGTYARTVTYNKPAHADMFSVSAEGDLFVRRGRNWDCIGGHRCGLLVGLRFGQYA